MSLFTKEKVKTTILFRPYIRLSPYFKNWFPTNLDLKSPSDMKFKNWIIYNLQVFKQTDISNDELKNPFSSVQSTFQVFSTPLLLLIWWSNKKYELKADANQGILDVAAALDPPLKSKLKFYWNYEFEAWKLHSPISCCILMVRHFGI